MAFRLGSCSTLRLDLYPSRSRRPWPDDSKIGPPERVPARHRICREGDPAFELLLIDAGVVKVCLPEEDGRVSLLALRTRGWMIGAAPAILGTPQLARIFTMTECVVRSLSHTAFQRMRREDPDISLWLQDMFAVEVAEQHIRSAAGHTGHKRRLLDRVLTELFTAASTPRENGSRRLSVPLGPTDVGELIGVSRQWADRLLTDMVQDGTIIREGGWLIAPNGSALFRHIAEP
jgi:CRP-like cAMP-binding protein